jgi:hypothetical protein
MFTFGSDILVGPGLPGRGWSPGLLVCGLPVAAVFVVLRDVPGAVPGRFERWPAWPEGRGFLTVVRGTVMCWAGVAAS